MRSQKDHSCRRTQASSREFVEKDFYVDDGLKSVPDHEGAIDLLRRTKAMLADANLRLHKIASNDPAVTQAFPVEDRASDLRNLDLHHDVVPRPSNPHKKTQNFVPKSQLSPRTQSPEFRTTLELIASYASRGGQT